MTFTEVDIKNLVNNSDFADTSFKDTEFVFCNDIYDDLKDNAEYFKKLKLSIKESNMIAKILEYNNASEMLSSSPTEHSLLDILNTLEIMKEDEYPFVPFVKDNTNKIILYKAKWQLEQLKYNKTEWQMIEALFGLYYDSVYYDKKTHKYDEHTFDQDSMTFEEKQMHKEHGKMPKLNHASFNCNYDVLENFIKYKHVSENLKTLCEQALKAYKVNEHKNAGRPKNDRCILMIDAQTNEIIERYQSISDIITYNPELKFDKSNISNCLKGKKKTYKGYIFKYYD